MIDTRLARETARLGHSATLRQQVYGLCDELDATRAKLNDVKQAYAALDQNWCNIHNAMGDAVRRALGLPDATVPEIVAAIDSIRPHRSPTVSAIASADIAERAGGCPCDECVEAGVET